MIETMIDELGVVLAEKAALAERERELKNAIIRAGVKHAHGALYDVTVSRSVRRSLDMKAVKAKLSAQFQRAHTIETSITRVDVRARSSKEAA